jgi:hypothetical protein
MAKDWQALTKLTGGDPFLIERVRLTDSAIRIEGEFDVPPLARLAAEDQVFVAAFVRCHGSIKQMEQFFGVSYPTIKNRLNRIGELLPFAEVEVTPPPTTTTTDLLSQLERGELSVREVLAQLRPDHDTHE